MEENFNEVSTNSYSKILRCLNGIRNTFTHYIGRQPSLPATFKSEFSSAVQSGQELELNELPLNNSENLIHCDPCPLDQNDRLNKLYTNAHNGESTNYDTKNLTGDSKIVTTDKDPSNSLSNQDGLSEDNHAVAGKQVIGFKYSTGDGLPELSSGSFDKDLDKNNDKPLKIDDSGKNADSADRCNVSNSELLCDSVSIDEFKHSTGKDVFENHIPSEIEINNFGVIPQANLTNIEVSNSTCLPWNNSFNLNSSQEKEFRDKIISNWKSLKNKRKIPELRLIESNKCSRVINDVSLTGNQNIINLAPSDNSENKKISLIEGDCKNFLQNDEGRNKKVKSLRRKSIKKSRFRKKPTNNLRSKPTSKKNIFDSKTNQKVTESDPIIVSESLLISNDNKQSVDNVPSTSESTISLNNQECINNPDCLKQGDIIYQESNDQEKVKTPLESENLNNKENLSKYLDDLKVGIPEGSVKSEPILVKTDKKHSHAVQSDGFRQQNIPSAYLNPIYVNSQSVPYQCMSAVALQPICHSQICVKNSVPNNYSLQEINFHQPRVASKNIPIDFTIKSIHPQAHHASMKRRQENPAKQNDVNYPQAHCNNQNKNNLNIGGYYHFRIDPYQFQNILLPYSENFIDPRYGYFDPVKNTWIIKSSFDGSNSKKNGEELRRRRYRRAGDQKHNG